MPYHILSLFVACAVTAMHFSYSLAANPLDLYKDAPLTSGFWLRECKQITSVHSFRSGVCQGEIQALLFLGFTDGLSENNKFCPPERATIEHAVQLTVQYIEQTEFYAIPLHFNALAALKKAWPCDASKAGR